MSATVETPERAASRPRQPHATAEERAARGRAARAETPRSSQAVWEPPAGRQDPVAGPHPALRLGQHRRPPGAGLSDRGHDPAGGERRLGPRDGVGPGR